jgi:hypothetical protein
MHVVIMELEPVAGFGMRYPVCTEFIRIALEYVSSYCGRSVSSVRAWSPHARVITDLTTTPSLCFPLSDLRYLSIGEQCLATRLFHLKSLFFPSTTKPCSSLASYCVSA